MDFYWRASLHPHYSSDLASSGFNVFTSLQNAKNNNKCYHGHQVKTGVKNFLILKQAEFYFKGINELTDEMQNMPTILLIEINLFSNFS